MADRWKKEDAKRTNNVGHVYGVWCSCGWRVYLKEDGTVTRCEQCGTEWKVRLTILSKARAE